MGTSMPGAISRGVLDPRRKNRTGIMQKISALINRIAELGLMVFLAALALVVFTQVVFRYVLQLPLFWTEETARYCLVWASLLGGGVALYRGQHIAVTVVVDRFPQNLRKLAARLTQLSITAIVVVILLGGIDLVMITQRQISPALRIPMSYPYMALPTGASIMLIHCISFFFRPVQSAGGEQCQL